MIGRHEFILENVGPDSARDLPHHKNESAHHKINSVQICQSLSSEFALGSRP